MSPTAPTNPNLGLTLPQAALIAGLGWVLSELGPFLLPNADLGFLFVTFLGELFFMAWLLIRGRKIPE